MDPHWINNEQPRKSTTKIGSCSRASPRSRFTRAGKLSGPCVMIGVASLDLPFPNNGDNECGERQSDRDTIQGGFFVQYGGPISIPTPSAHESSVEYGLYSSLSLVGHISFALSVLVTTTHNSTITLCRSAKGLANHDGGTTSCSTDGTGGSCHHRKQHFAHDNINNDDDDPFGFHGPCLLGRGGDSSDNAP